MTKMFASQQSCIGATSGVTGRKYDTDKATGLISVSDPRDVKAFKDSGYYQIAGGMPRLKKYWVCECGWEACINSCGRCGNINLRKVEK